MGKTRFCLGLVFLALCRQGICEEVMTTTPDNTQYCQAVLGLSMNVVSDQMIIPEVMLHQWDNVPYVTEKDEVRRIVLSNFIERPINARNSWVSHTRDIGTFYIEYEYDLRRKEWRQIGVVLAPKNGYSYWTPEHVYFRDTLGVVHDYLLTTQVDLNNKAQQAIHLAERNGRGGFSLVGSLLNAHDLSIASREFSVKYDALSTTDGLISSLRDPSYIEIGASKEVVFATKARRQNGELVPAIGRARLGNLNRLEKTVLEPVILPDFEYDQLEVPNVFAIGNDLYLIASVKKFDRQKTSKSYIVGYRSESGKLSGPWIPAGIKQEVIFDEDAGIYAVKTFSFRGQILASGFIETRNGQTRLTGIGRVTINDGKSLALSF